MQVYEITEKRVLASAAEAYKEILPDGKIKLVLKPGGLGGKEFIFANEKHLKQALKDAQKRINSKLPKLGTFKKIASWGVLKPVTYVIVGEAIYSVVRELASGDPNSEALQKDLAQVAVIAAARVAAVIVKSKWIRGIFKAAIKSGKYVTWAKTAMNARRVVAISTTALAAAGPVTAGTSWVPMIATATAWVLLEIAIYLAIDWVVESALEDFFKGDVLEQEIRENLEEEIYLIYGLSLPTPKPGQKYPQVGNMPDEIINQPVDLDKFNALADDPKYQKTFDKYRRDRRSIRRDYEKISDLIPKESIQEENESPKKFNMKGFLDHLDDRGYSSNDIATAKKAIVKAKQKADQDKEAKQKSKED